MIFSEKIYKGPLITSIIITSLIHMLWVTKYILPPLVEPSSFLADYLGWIIFITGVSSLFCLAGMFLYELYLSLESWYYSKIWEIEDKED